MKYEIFKSLYYRAFKSLYYRAFKSKIISRLSFYIKNGTHYKHKNYSTDLNNALNKINIRTDISDHLGTIFYTAVDSNPKLIVELGTRGGESTRALLAAASITNSTVLSIDIDDCSKTGMPLSEYWHFIQADDVEFAKTGFKDWCSLSLVSPVIDFLFIDTSHEYEHTKQEIREWSGFLSKNGTMMFHDTNMGNGVYARHDGSIGTGWDNNRGVMRAIEEFTGNSYDENTYFCDITDGYSLMHFPNCNGLTIIKKRGAKV
jgi:predicted O-methyltransferase YrrM